MDTTNNINTANQNQAENLYALDLGTEVLPPEADELLSNANQALSEANTNPVQTQFQEQTQNELRQLEEEVQFQQNNNVVAERSEYINTLEQERMQRLKQRDLLVNLRREQVSTSGQEYTRNLDETVLMNANKKDMQHPDLDQNPERPGQIFQEADRTYIDPASEEFNEEFINNQKEKRIKDEGEQQQRGSGRQQNEEELEEENEEPTFSPYSFEEDEVLDIDYRIMALSEELDRKQGAPESLTKEIEKRIKRLSSIMDQRRKDLLVADPRPSTQTSSDTGLPLATPGKSSVRGTNKLRKKFFKSR